MAIENSTREQQRQVAKLVTEQLVKDIHIDTAQDPPENLTDIRQPRALLSEEQHSNTTP